MTFNPKLLKSLVHLIHAAGCIRAMHLVYTNKAARLNLLADETVLIAAMASILLHIQLWRQLCEGPVVSSFKTISELGAIAQKKSEEMYTHIVYFFPTYASIDRLYKAARLAMNDETKTPKNNLELVQLIIRAEGVVAINLALSTLSGWYLVFAAVSKSSSRTMTNILEVQVVMAVVAFLLFTLCTANVLFFIMTNTKKR